MAPTMAMKTLAIAEMIALIPPPIALKIDPCNPTVNNSQKPLIDKGTMLIRGLLV